MDANQIFQKLPYHLKNRIQWVGRQYRVNSLSHIPGGSDVIIEYQNQKIMGYDWVKMPSLYIKKICDAEITRIYVGYSNYDESEQFDAFKKHFHRIYARKYEDNGQNDVMFEEIWNSETANSLPFKSLQKFDALSGMRKMLSA